jgi:hypothetical protein
MAQTLSKIHTTTVTGRQRDTPLPASSPEVVIQCNHAARPGHAAELATYVTSVGERGPIWG